MASNQCGWLLSSCQGYECTPFPSGLLPLLRDSLAEQLWDTQACHSGAALKLRIWALISAWPTLQLLAGPQTLSVQSLTDQTDMGFICLIQPAELDSWLLNLAAATWLAHLVQMVWDSPTLVGPPWDFSVNYQANYCSAEHAIQAGLCRCLQIHIMFSMTKDKHKVMNYSYWNNCFYSWKQTKIIQNFYFVYLATKLSGKFPGGNQGQTVVSKKGQKHCVPI